ncbi:MAG: hypothetical protein H0T46_24450 [Deltaproteobacteria bacterium]|nr:hypothetical protein [Deltaproteobacteria bacterium]
MSNRFTKLLTAAVLIGTPATALATPRTLPSGAPACGNTMGKGGYGDDCTAEERAAWRAERLRQRNLEIQHERARRAAAKQRELAKAAAEAKQTFVQLVSAVLPPRVKTGS